MNIQQFDFSVNLMQALLWRHNDAARLIALIEQKEVWYDTNQRDFWDAWVRDVFDLRTANDFGLAVWARILDVPLVISVPASDDREVFGFGIHNLNFFESNFGRDTAGTINLTTEQKRLLLRLRYFQLITTDAIPEVNAFLKLLFSDLGRVYVLDGQDMTITYIFEFVPAAQLRQVFDNFDVLPRGAGVEIDLLVRPGDNFGFAPYYQNFGNGNFNGA